MAIAEQMCDNLSGAGQRVNADRPLTHPLGRSEEGLAVNATLSKNCLHCGEVIPYDRHGGPKAHDRRKFCSHSCRALYYGASQPSFQSRLWAKVAVAGPDECWRWTAATVENKKSGLRYCVIRRTGRREARHVLAHVAA